MTTIEHTTLEQAANPAFPRDQYLLSAPPGRPRVSSWVDGRQRALMFYWEDPRNRRVYMLRTQAPYITEILQRFFGTRVDGRFGELTRAAIVNHARANGVNFAPNTPATGPLLAYALQTAFLNGGRVAFPPSMDYPDTNHPVLATSPDGRRYSTVYALDHNTGHEVSGNPADLPAAPATSTQTHSLAQSNQQPSVPGAPPIYAPDVTYSPTTTNVTQVSQQQTNTNVLSGNTVNFPGVSVGNVGDLPPGTFTPPELGSWQTPPAPPAPVLNPFIRPLPADGKCPKGFVPVGDGTCKLSAFIRFDGHLLLPNPGDVVVEYGKPETYVEAFPWLKKTKEKV